MTLYYEDDLVQLHHGDCLDILPAVTPGSVDHMVTDPPYMLNSSSFGTKTGGWADIMNASTWYATWYRLASETLRHTGSLWTFGNWRSIPVMLRAAMDAGLAATSLAVWDKDWIGPAGPQALRSQHEICMVLAKPGFRLPDRSQGDVIRVKASSFKPTGHPAEKPEPLLRRICELTGAPTGALIADAFAGSGTTLVAAKSLGLRAVGIEAEERYCEIAARRLMQDALQFDTEEAS